MTSRQKSMIRHKQEMAEYERRKKELAKKNRENAKIVRQEKVIQKMMKDIINRMLEKEKAEKRMRKKESNALKASLPRRVTRSAIKK